MFRYAVTLMALSSFLVSCGSSQRLTRAAGSSFNNSPGSPLQNSSCTTPITGALRRLSSSPSAELTTGAPVQWELTLSGGCSNQYRLDGVPSVVTSPYLFQKSYGAGNNQRETVRASAVYADGTLNPLAQAIVSDSFNVVTPVSAPLVCELVASQPTITAPADNTGTLLTATPPAVIFSARTLRQGVPVPSRIRALTQLNPALPVEYPPALLPMTADVATAQIPISFRKAGTHVFALEMASNDGVGLNAVSCVVIYNVVGVVTAPPVIGQFRASVNPVLAGGSTVFTWVTTGNPTGCRLWGSVRGYSNTLPANGSLEIRNITVREEFTFECVEVESTPIVINVVAPPASINLSFNTPNGMNNPNDASKMSGQPSPALTFQDLGSPGGDNYGQFFYPGVEMEAYVNAELGIHTSHCSQVKAREGNGLTDSAPYLATYINGNLRLPVGDVGVYAWGHGGADVQVAITTNYRRLSLRSRYNRWAGNQSPYIFTNGAKVVMGLRSLGGINGYATTITLAPGEIVTGFQSSNDVFDNAGLPGGLWRVQCR